MFGWVRACIGKSNKTIRRSAQRVSLFPAVVFALMAGVFVAFAAYQVVSRYTPTSKAEAAPIDVTKVALTIVAGVGGVVALVIAYRRQRDVEQSRFVERFGAAAAQLGASDVAVRIAGVYAMAGAADEAGGLRRQQCIDVLCGYLRLPYDTEHGASGRTQLVIKTPWVEHGQVRRETEEHVMYRQNDSEVRKTIVRVIAERLRQKAEYSWSASNFDFRAAHLEDVDLSQTTFTGSVRFDEATFSGNTWFEQATFSAAAVFDGATFSGNAWFGRATFSGNAGFGRATFSGDTMFGQTTFSRDVWFGRATFSRDAWFGQTTFSGNAWFGRATFSDDAWFENVVFSGDTVFQDVTFSGYARFAGSMFAGRTTFLAADFGSKPISFTELRQWGSPPPEFDWNCDVSQKPSNVEPQDWPPVVSSA